jgi:hypothetical protein
MCPAPKMMSAGQAEDLNALLLTNDGFSV